MTAAILGLDWAISVRAAIPPLSLQTTKAPTARNATSLTIELDRNGQNETVLMLLGIDAPGAERHCEGGEQQGDRQIERGRGRVRRQPGALERMTTIKTVGATALS